MNNDEKNCPFCGEYIKAVAIKCKHCQSDLSMTSVKENTNREIIPDQENQNKEKQQMFLKSGENLPIEDPDEEKFKQTFINMKNEVYCLSADRRVGSIYSEYAEELLEIKKKSNNYFEISIQEKKNPNESALETVKSLVDLSTAIKIAVSYTTKNNSWKNLTEWKIDEESVFGIFYAFYEIVLKPSKAVIIFFIISVLLAIGIAVFLHKNFSPSKFFKSNDVTVKKEMPEFIIGDIVKNEFFSYKVNSFQFADRVGSLLLGINAGQDNKYLIIDVEIKNIDKESRYLDAGEVRVSYNGKWLKYEQPEAVLSEDYIIFDVLNPLTTTRGKVAFKVPKELNGPFYWVPPRTDGLIKLTNQREKKLETRNTSPSKFNTVKYSCNGGGLNFVISEEKVIIEGVPDYYKFLNKEYGMRGLDLFVYKSTNTKNNEGIEYYPSIGMISIIKFNGLEVVDSKTISDCVKK